MMEKTRTKKRKNIEGIEQRDDVEVLGGRFQYSRPRVFFSSQSQTPSASNIVQPILPTTDEIEGSANLMGMMRNADKPSEATWPMHRRI
jgi:hypothetical protein